MRGALAALPAPWVVLANRCASGADAPPWARFIALHPGKGIALVDIDSPDAAVAPLEDFLSRAGLSSLRDGAPPIAPVALRGGEADAIADRLDAALAPMHGEFGNPSWSKSAVELLLTAPDLALTRIRRVAPATDATRAAPSNYQGHAVEAWHVLLARSGMRGPDSALLDWPSAHSWRPVAAVAALLLVTIGARAVQEFGPSRFHAAALQPAMTTPDLTADALAHAMLLPTVGTPLPATLLTLSQLPVPSPQLTTLTPTPAPPLQPAVVTPPPKPVMPASHTAATKPPPATLRPKLASKPATPQNFSAAAGPAAKPDVDVNAAWYDRDATTASNAGLMAFVAPGARHDDLIPASLGTARLASGTTATLDFYGDGLLNVAIDGKALARTIDPSTGKPLGAAVGNTRRLKTARGSVLVTANVAANVVDDVINTAGVVPASSASEQNGQIVLKGGSSSPGGSVQVAGTKGPSANPSGGASSIGGGSLENQGVVYTTTSVTVAQDATDTTSIAASVGGTVTGAAARGAADANAIATSVGKNVADLPATVTHVGRALGAVNSALARSATSLTKPLASLGPPGR